jgi:polyisoprenoid-binding protein YceI
MRAWVIGAMAVAGALFGGPAAVLPALAITLEEAAGSYRVADNSQIRFSVGQVGGGGIAGEFATFTCTLQLNAADPSRSVVVFDLYPESVSTGQQRIDDFLRSAAVFDTANYDVVSFRSIDVRLTGPDTAVVHGIVTARGKSAEADFDVALTGEGPGSLQFRVTGDIMRSPFGMEVGTPIYSNVVRFDMQLETMRR